jgi:hypothetical protein
MNIRKPKTKSGLEDAIEDALRELKGHDTTTKEYSTAVDQIVKLHALKQNEKQDRVSKDTLAIVAGNLLGIVMIVGHERAHVITSKAISFVGKFR